MVTGGEAVQIAVGRGRAWAARVGGHPVGVVLVVWAAWRAGHLLLQGAHGALAARSVYTLDGDWYRKVLEHGYSVGDPTFTAQEDVAFFPGLVWLAAPVAWVLGPLVAAHLAATLTSLAAFFGLHAAVGAVTGDAAAARRSLVALAIWPTSVVMTAFYSEGLFVAVTALGIWSVRRDHAAGGAAAALLAALTRPIGVGLGVALAVGRVVARRRVDAVAVLWAASGAAGLGTVALVQHLQAGHALGFVDAQAAWGRAVAAPWTAVGHAVSEIRRLFPDHADYVDWSLDLVVLALVALGLVRVTGWARARRRHPEGPVVAAWTALVAWGWFAWAAPTFTTLLSSSMRFAVAAWPAVLAVVVGPAGRRPWLRWGLVVAAGLVTLWVADAWWAGLTSPLYT